MAQPPPTPTPQSPGVEVAQASFDLPDPFLLDAKGQYFLYLSSMYFNDNQNIPVLIDAGGHWTHSSIDAVPKLPSWAASNPNGYLSWAPSVYRLDGTYVMYFAPTMQSSVATGPVQHCIAVATSTSPTGPFTVQGNPIICHPRLSATPGNDRGGDIDPALFVDPNGPDGPSHPNYLLWKSDNNNVTSDDVTHIFAQPLSNDGLHLLGHPVQIFQPDQTWEGNLVEAPRMAQAPDGSLWLFFSGGAGVFTPNYGLGVVRCASPLGPCHGGDGQPLVTSNKQGPGPGEETYFTAKDGSTWLLYNPWYAGVPFVPVRPADAVRIGWSPVGPYVAAAGTFPSP